jgi:prephenate dehydratase
MRCRKPATQQGTARSSDTTSTSQAAQLLEESRNQEKLLAEAKDEAAPSSQFAR